jgi:hypothetical protein
MGSRRSILMMGLAVLTALAMSSVASAESRRTELASVGPGGANVTGASLEAVSKDGSKVFFTTGDALVPEDNDGLCDRGFDYETGQPYPPTPCQDVYVRDIAAGTTKLVSTGPTGGSGHADARLPLFQRQDVSDDGNLVFFETAEPLVSQDTDTLNDVYQRDLATGTTRLISTGPSDQGLFDAKYGGASTDGSRALFYTEERLVPEDVDSEQDFYERAGDMTILLSTGPDGGNGPWPAGGVPGSTDGTRVLIATREALLAEDTDDCPSIIPGPCSDVYARDLSTGTLELVSTGPHGNQNNYGTQVWGASADGTRVFFSTAEPLVDEDVEANCPSHDGLGEVGCVDIYERNLATDTTTLISTGPKKTGNDGSGLPKGTADDAFFDYVSPDGSRVFFRTAEQLVDADTDSSSDVYEREGNTTTLLSASAIGGNSGQRSVFQGTSTDGSIAFVNTLDRLVPEDTDDQFDIYQRSGDEVRLASGGPAGGNGPFDAYSTERLNSSDGKRVFFYTPEQLVPEDTNGATDLYEWFDGTTTVVSKGPTGSGTGGAPSVRLSDDARNVFFTTPQKLVPEDTDTTADIYVSIASANGPPDCDAVTSDRALLWPANRRFRTVTISGATDPDGDAVTLSITGVTQDEPVGGVRDAAPTGEDSSVRLRAERDLARDGRVYRIAFEASDGQGGSCNGVVKVSVPRRRGVAAVDSAPPSYDSFGH